MSKLLLRWILLVISVVITSMLTSLIGLSFQVEFKNSGQIFQLFIAVAILAFLNATLGKILKLMTLPLNCMTFGLFSLVINAAVLWFTARLDVGLKITGSAGQQFLSALVASVLIAAISGALGSFLKDDKDKDDKD